MQAISGILASRATMLAPILAATPNKYRTNHLRIMGLARVLAHGIVESPLLRMTKPRAFLRALSQNRDSAARVSLCYGLLAGFCLSAGCVPGAGAAAAGGVAAGFCAGR